MSKHSENALQIYKNLYFNPGETTPEEVHLRVAKCIGDNDDQFKMFKRLLDDQIIRPNSPCMINAKENLLNQDLELHDKNLMACFVLGLDDSMDSIMKMWSDAATIYAGAGGAGIPITNLREAGSKISIGGVASGPLGYLNVIETISNTVKSGGKSRRAANLASFWFQHPDIIDLINSKINKDKYSAINVSVLITDEFMNNVANKKFNKQIDLISPNKNQIVGQITTGELWNAIVKATWTCADPGLLFYDTCNRTNPFPTYGDVEATNPCLPGWAPVLTPDGYKHFIDVKNEIVIDGETQHCSDLIKTRENAEVYEVELQNGMCLYGTEDHKVTTKNGDVEIQNLKQSHLIEVDYTPIKFELDQNEINFGANKYYELVDHQKTTDLLKLSINQQIGFIRELLSWNINKIDAPTTYQIIKSSPRINKRIINDTQLILTSLGIYSNYLKESGELVLAESVKILNFKSEFPFPNLNNLKHYQKIKSIKQFSTDDVYDIKVPDGNHFVSSGVVVHNCGEVALPPRHCCILLAINLNKIIRDNGIDWKLLREYVENSILFLDNMIDKTSYPNELFEKAMKQSRPVGLGLMGFADILYKLRMRYGSNESLQLFEDICKFMTKTAFEYSIKRVACGKVESIPIPNSDRSRFRKLLEDYTVDNKHLKLFDEFGIRNSHVSCIAPTGSTAISADCSYAFEPMFAIVWKKQLVDKKGELTFINNEFLKAMNESGIIFEKDKLIADIIFNNGSVQDIEYVPEDIKNVFVTADDVGWENKIKMQATGQKYISLAISSTCNLPNSATEENISDAFVLAWKLGLKGIAIYRDGCLSEQPVNFGNIKKDKVELEPFKRPIRRHSETVEIPTPIGNLYVTGSVDENGKLFEVFLNLGNIGHLDNLLLNTLARVISKSLQNHLSPEVIIDTIMGMGGETFWFRLQDNQKVPFQAKSIVDAIAITLDNCFNKGKTMKIDTKTNEINRFEKCPSCGKMSLNKSVGCKSGLCESCGFSACG